MTFVDSNYNVIYPETVQFINANRARAVFATATSGFVSITFGQGTSGTSGADGVDGQDGTNGINCWDVNGDGIDDLSEDVNGDGIWDALDCAGADGADGQDGADGADGEGGK